MAGFYLGLRSYEVWLLIFLSVSVCRADIPAFVQVWGKRFRVAWSPCRPWCSRKAARWTSAPSLRSARLGRPSPKTVPPWAKGKGRGSGLPRRPGVTCLTFWTLNWETTPLGPLRLLPVPSAVRRCTRLERAPSARLTFNSSRPPRGWARWREKSGGSLTLWAGEMEGKQSCQSLRSKPPLPLILFFLSWSVFFFFLLLLSVLSLTFFRLGMLQLLVMWKRSSRHLVSSCSSWRLRSSLSRELRRKQIRIRKWPSFDTFLSPFFCTDVNRARV